MGRFREPFVIIAIVVILVSLLTSRIIIIVIMIAIFVIQRLLLEICLKIVIVVITTILIATYYPLVLEGQGILGPKSRLPNGFTQLRPRQGSLNPVSRNPGEVPEGPIRVPLWN